MIKEKGGKEDKPKRGKGGEVACISVRRRLVDDIKATTETLSGSWSNEIKAGGLTESPHGLVHPVAALAARRALPAGLVLVEEAESGDGLDDVHLLVHDDDGRRAQARLRRHQRVEVHHDVVAHPVRILHVE